MQILKSNAPISELVQQQADQYGFIAKVSEFCKTPQKLTLFVNSDIQGLEIPQTALIDMFINIDGGGAAAKAAYVRSKIDAGTQPQDAAESLILVMAGVIKTAANKSYQIKEADSHEASWVHTGLPTRSPPLRALSIRAKSSNPKRRLSR